MPSETIPQRAKAAFLHLAELEPKITSHHWEPLKHTGLECVMRVMEEKDCSYLPNFKWMDFVANAVTLTRSIAQETQMQPNEATALLRSMLSDQAESVRRMRLEASLERARYEPMMLQNTHIKQWGSERRATLNMRWEKMKQAQQSHYVLAADYMEQADHAVASAISSKEFRNYRIGPTLQLFAEILHMCRASATEGASTSKLKRLLSPNGKLWRSYVLKAERYKKQSPPPKELLKQANTTNVH